MAEHLTLNFEIYRGDDLLFKEQISAESVNIGKGPAAMLRIEDDTLADLQAVINLSDEGTVQILDLVGSGTKVNGNEVVNSELVSGDNIEIGEIRILVEMEGEVTATNPTVADEDDEVTDASVHTVGDIDFSQKSEQEILEEDISEDVMAFIMRSGTAQSDVGIDRSKPQVLEVAEIWGDVIMDVRHFRGGQNVTLGTSTGFKWYILGQPLSLDWTRLCKGCLARLHRFSPRFEKRRPMISTCPPTASHRRITRSSFHRAMDTLAAFRSDGRLCGCRR